MIGLSEKSCGRCGGGINGKRSDALFCSVLCRNAQRQERFRRVSPEKAKSSWRKYALSSHGTETLLLNYARDRARRNDLDFDLDREWIAKKLATGVCELSGLFLKREFSGNFKTDPYAPSLDRVKPELGYVKPNVRLVCFAVNRARSDWGDEVLLTIASGLVKHLTA